MLALVKIIATIELEFFTDSLQPVSSITPIEPVDYGAERPSIALRIAIGQSHASEGSRSVAS